MATVPQQRYGNAYRGGHDEKPEPLDTSKIRFKDIHADLFDSVAQKVAETIADNRKSNKPTQLRRFYNEIVMWENKASLQPDRFDEYLPFIRMINAKAAYAKGRTLIDDNFVKLLHDSLDQVDSVKTLQIFKLFMEAFMGFYKEKRPKD
ncbi:type III-A CRISPR-associated protein Csm2 [Methylomonas paludis]|uniref:CRISPR system Cms protein Csm2 n=1 Tax=Methylomonas paludis TaxID=1173101 RepID=A0A975MPB6_9GAMM|nr:type III-A CRISPR-associated protein Csm2 [Methylomonas paludis]QWF71558.1 type III-A CRISPR-associated protein Csm2 [Methylomonas paludis]